MSVPGKVMWRYLIIFLPVVGMIAITTTLSRDSSDSVMPPKLGVATHMQQEGLDSIVLQESNSERNDQKSLDTVLYERFQLHLLHDRPTNKWPPKTPYPLPGAVLPYRRIVAYYGNFYSKGMGVLGELPREEMIKRLQEEVKRWQHADPVIPAQAALHYIAVTAQARPGTGAKYRLRMPHSELDKVIALANSIDALVFLDVQVGHSTLQEELPALEPYLSLSNVHLGIDPEYSMKSGNVPCDVIGTFDASDVNYASSYLAGIVKKYQVPPKILVVHRFTKPMITNYRNIVTRAEVQIVMNMDGFGSPAKKKDSYIGAVVAEPVQFTGFKVFYKNDRVAGRKDVMQPIEIMELYPRPIYIQYQ